MVTHPCGEHAWSCLTTAFERKCCHCVPLTLHLAFNVVSKTVVFWCWVILGYMWQKFYLGNTIEFQGQWQILASIFGQLVDTNCFIYMSDHVQSKCASCLDSKCLWLEGTVQDFVFVFVDTTWLFDLTQFLFSNGKSSSLYSWLALDTLQFLTHMKNVSLCDDQC